MRVGPATLRFDWSRASLNMDFPGSSYVPIRMFRPAYNMVKMVYRFSMSTHQDKALQILVLSGLESVKVCSSSRSTDHNLHVISSFPVLLQLNLLRRRFLTIVKGMFGLPRFLLIFLFMKSKGANFA